MSFPKNGLSICNKHYALYQKGKAQKSKKFQKPFSPQVLT